MKRRDFCKTAAALLAAGTLAPHAAADALLPEETQAVVGSIVPEDRYPMTFRSDHSETDLTHDFYYTDAFFENTALKYDHRLALATLGLVAACGNTYRSDDLYWLEGEAGREDHIAAAYRELGFANPVCVGYQSSLNTPADRAGCAFAQKTLVQQGGSATCIWGRTAGIMALSRRQSSSLQTCRTIWPAQRPQPESWAPSNCGWAATAAARPWQTWPPPGCAGSCRRSRRRTPMCTPLQPRRH